MAGISGKVLTDTLRDLVRDGIVLRHAYGEIPRRVEYELTELGRTLSGPLGALGRRAEQHFDEVQRAREAYDTRRSATAELTAERFAQLHSGKA